MKTEFVERVMQQSGLSGLDLWYELDKVGQQIIKSALTVFIAEVNTRAEKKMLKTGKLEGSHYTSMQELAKEIGL